MINDRQFAAKYNNDEILNRLQQWIRSGNVNLKYKLLGFDELEKNVNNLVLQSYRVGDYFIKYSKIFTNDVLKDCKEFEYSFEKAKEYYSILKDWIECTDIIDSDGFLLHPARFYKEMKYSIFLKCRYPIPLTEFEFCKTLHDYAIEMLSKSKFSFFIENADAKKLNEYKLKLLSFNSKVLSIKKEREYTSLVRKWIFGQVEYIKALQECKKVIEKTTQQSISANQSSNKSKHLANKEKTLKDIWLKDEDHYNSVIAFLTENNIAIDTPFIMETNNKLNWQRFNDNISYLAGFAKVCMRKGFIDNQLSAPKLAAILTNTFNITFNKKPLEAQSLNLLDDKYTSPFSSL